MKAPHEVPDVSVVIPTTGRQTLTRAIESAVLQVGVRVEVLVVADLADDALGRARMRASIGKWGADVHLHFTGGQRGASAARNIGAAVARSQWIAYLDDDDWWTREKLRTQLGAASNLPSGSVVSCQAISVDSATGSSSEPVPLECYRVGEDLARYLFLKRRLSVRRHAVFAPTLLVPTELARSVGWNERLARHQDWDFLLRLLRVPGVTLHQIDAALTYVSVGSPSSISGSPDWRESLNWALANKSQWDGKTFSDFVVAQPLRYALSGRSFTGVKAAVTALVRTDWPSWSCIVLGVSGALPRSVYDWAMHVRGRRRADPGLLGHGLDGGSGAVPEHVA